MAASPQELLDRNARLIFTLNELLRIRQGAEPEQAERKLWLEACENLATVAAAIPPKNLIANTGIQPYIDWAWTSGALPAPRFTPPASISIPRYSIHPNTDRRTGPPYGPPITGSGIVSAAEGAKLQESFQPASMPVSSNGDTLLSSASCVNVVSPLEKGASTAPVVISTQQNKGESKSNADVKG